MEPGSGVKRSSEPQRTDIVRSAASASDSAERSRPLLSEEQRAVVDILQSEGCGLTARQLQARLPYPAEDVAQALCKLIELRLVTRLNTLVPSYACRAIDAERGRR